MENRISNLNQILNKNLPDLSKINTYDGSTSIPIITNLFRRIAQEKNFYILNFVLPANDNISYLLTYQICMDEILTNYKTTLNNYSEILQPGMNVELCNSGKIYKYAGLSEKYKNFVRIETIPIGGIGKASIEKEIKDIFQFFPTKKEVNLRNVGKNDWKNLKQNSLDTTIGVKTYKNPILIKNNIILLTKKERFESFIKSQIINGAPAKNIINPSYINERGEIPNVYDPLLYASDLNSIYEFFKKNDDKKIIITDQINKLSDVTLLNQVLEISPSKFILFSNEIDFEKIANFHKKKKHLVWKFEKSEIKEWHNLNNQIKKQGNDKNFDNGFQDDYPSKINLIFKNTIDQDIQFTNFKENIFDTLTLNLKKLSQIESENSDEISEILADIYILKHKIQDYIFGPDDDVKLFYETTKTKIKEFFNYQKNFFNNDEYNLLNKVILNLENIDLDNSSLFEARRTELQKMLLDELSVYNSTNTSIISDNPKMQIYYKKNIKQKWNLDIDVNTTQTPKKVYKYAIVPSEFSKDRITKLINEHKFQIINFFSTPTIKEKINDVIKYNKIKWKRYHLDNEKKIELVNIDNKLQHTFSAPEHSMYDASFLTNSDKKIDLEALLDKPFDRNKLKSESNEEDDIDARVLIFYGNAYGYFTENTDFKLINNLFDTTRRKDNLIREVSFKDLKIDDFLLIRDSSDSDVIESEAKLKFKDPNDYEKLRLKSRKWFDVLIDTKNKNNLSISNIFNKMHLSGYTKSRATLRNLANNLIICPDEYIDIVILIKSLEDLTNQSLLNESEIKQIHSCSQKLKSTHRNAGRLLSKKILVALKDQDVDVGREPVRVDYNKDGTITLNSQDSDKPEAWIVQVQEIEKNKFKVSQSELNNLKY